MASTNPHPGAEASGAPHPDGEAEAETVEDSRPDGAASGAPHPDGEAVKGSRPDAEVSKDPALVLAPRSDEGASTGLTSLCTRWPAPPGSPPPPRHVP
ncbi:hypothetical protein [Streptomyces sp. NPDC047525]|uniref:hypothetical protein n=1 Tax=Streptomyces sp. NPDC047525 TaxID=3155264 RepID=UPI0033D368C1